jgi:hypothetical protein
MGNLIIFEENMTVQCCQNFEITFFHTNVHNFIKNKVFGLFKNKSLSKNICPQTVFSQFLSLAFFYEVPTLKIKISNISQFETNTIG